MWGNETERRAFGEIWPLWHGGTEVRDRRRAVQRLRPLADQGHAPAQFALGWACFDGDGVRRDHAKSFQYCLAAAEQGYPAAEGMVGSYYAMARPKHGACPSKRRKPSVGTGAPPGTATAGPSTVQPGLGLSGRLRGRQRRGGGLCLDKHCGPVLGHHEAHGGGAAGPGGRGAHS